MKGITLIQLINSLKLVWHQLRKVNQDVQKMHEDIENGVFDGEPGPQGEPGPKGDPMTWETMTQEQKNELASDVTASVLESLPTWNGGTY